MRKPNFFIVGAPRCGTTALLTYLRSHPEIFMSIPKEPHYFDPEVGFPGRVEIAWSSRAYRALLGERWLFPPKLPGLQKALLLVYCRAFSHERLCHEVTALLDSFLRIAG